MDKQKKIVENYGPGYLHSFAGAAVRMGVSRETLNSFIADGLIVPIHIPGAKRERIAEWQLEECTREMIHKSDKKIVSARTALDYTKMKLMDKKNSVVGW
jgi:predicted site-specific integrase-resolvase